MIAHSDRHERTAIRRVGGTVPLGNIGLVVAAVGALCGLLGGRMVDTGQVDGLGLLRALPALYWAGVVLGVVATFLLLRAAVAGDTGRHAAAVPILWLLLLHTAPQLAHAHPRFPMAWTHVGLLRVIDESGTADIAVDPRLGWPGVYGVFMAPMARLDDRLLEGVVRLWPTLTTGGAAILVAALGRRSYPTTPLIGSLSALLYVLLAWTGQDYFSPRSIGLLWFVGMIVLLESGPLETGSAWSGMVPFLSRFSASGGDRRASRSAPAFVTLIVFGLGTVVSDPMAPLFICLALFILGLHGRSLAWRLLLLVGLGYVVWFLVSGHPWWSDGPGDLTRPFAGLLDQTPAALAEPSAAASPDHRFVTRSRLLLTLATFAVVLMIGTAMGRERGRQLRPAVPLVALAAMPVLVVLPAGYRGAAMINTVWFTLPFAGVLAGRLLASLGVRSLPVVGAVVTAVLCPLLLLTRFGGERFEFTTAPDRAAIQAAYDSADDDTLFVADNPFVPWRDRGLGGNAFASHAVEKSEAWLDMVESEAAAAGKQRVVVVLTNGQVGWSIHGRGQEADTLDEFAEWLLARPDSELLFHEESSWAIEP